MRLPATVRLAVAAVYVLGLCAPLRAELPVDHPVTLAQCLDHAMENHSRILSAQKRVDMAGADLTKARAGYFPTLTASSEYSKSDVTGTDGSGDLTGSGGVGSRHTHTLGVTQTLLDGWRTPTAIKQASASERAALADLELARQERVMAVTTAYYESLLASRLAGIAAQTINEVEEQRTQVQARIEAGDAAPIDIYPVDVQLAEARLAGIRADNAKRVAANTLYNQIGLPPGPELQLLDTDEPTSGTPDLQDCIQSALNQRPDLIAAAADIDAQKAALTYAKLQTGPIPTASATYRRGYGDSLYDSEWQVGAGLTMYIFDGGALAADVKSVRARLESLDLAYQQMEMDIRTEVEQAYLNHISALEQFEASKTGVTLARTNVEVAREKYQVGLGITLEIATAERQYSEAQASHAQALYDTYITLARLDRAVGRRDYRVE